MAKKDDPKSLARFMRKLTTPLHRGLYRLTGGKLGGKAVGMPILLLTTTGRTSGKERTRPLGYIPDGETYVIVAAAGGVPQHPDWYLNLRANPNVDVQIGDAKSSMRAETAGPEDRARLWPIITSKYSFFQRYQDEVTREIPVVILRPASTAGTQPT